LAGLRELSKSFTKNKKAKGQNREVSKTIFAVGRFKSTNRAELGRGKP